MGKLMEKNRIPHARRIWHWLAAALAITLLTGCDDLKITNLTPSSLPANPSQIYTFSAKFDVKSRGYVEGSLQPQIVIDGQIHDLAASPLGPEIYEFDYQIPANRGEVTYYFLATYNVSFSDKENLRESYSPVTTATLTSRQVLSMISNRGPVGARIGIVGQGFTPQDVVSLNGQPTRTVFESSNSLSFFVPAVPPARNYQVQVDGPNGSQNVGPFRVDPLGIEVFPSSLILRQGETQSVTFTLPQTAPSGGLLLDITTDVPDSVIMAEVVVPAGTNSVTVPVRGGLPGNGALYLTGFGGGEVVIPITVQ
jgi:hypothetical protein